MKIGITFRHATIIFSLVIGVSLGSAKDTYISQTGAGSNTGADCTTARPVSWFNTVANWGSGASQITPGDRIHLCGTFVGSANSTMITIQGDGSSGNPVTVLFEPGARLSAPYWSTTNGAVSCTGRNYITIDGGSDGLIENTANGTTLANQKESIGVYLNGCNNTTVKNLIIKNIYVRTSLTADSAGGDSAAINALDGDNLLVTRNTISNARDGVGYAFRTNHSNLEVSFNTMSGVEVGVIAATGSAGAVQNGVLIHDNDFQGGSYLWDTSNNAFHHNVIHMWAQATNAHINNTHIYNNYVHGVWGGDQAYLIATGGTHITSLFYMEEIGGVAQIYNNVLDLSAGGALNSTDNGMVFCKESTGQQCNCYNNTFIANGGDVAFETAGGAGHVFKNNLLLNVAYGLYLPGGDNTVTSDYNVYFGVKNWGKSFDTFAQWQAQGQDAHSKNGITPNLTPTYRLSSGSPAIGAGTNLTGLSMLGLAVDKAGVARSTTAAWDIGAYQFSGSGSSLPAAPLNLTVLLH